MTRNSISGNGVTPNDGGAASSQIGIDLQSAADDAARGTSPFVTLNDNGDGDAGGNGLLNFPVLESAVLSNGTFTVTGWARPGSTIELFVADGDASGFGEGATYVATLTEGSASDLDAGASAYAVTGQRPEPGHRQHQSLPLHAGAARRRGGRHAAHRHRHDCRDGTSEFSGLVTVTTGVSVSGFGYADANHNAQRTPARPAPARRCTPSSCAAAASSASQVVAVTPATGAYTFTFVTGGTWTVVLDDSNNPADITPGVPERLATHGERERHAGRERERHQPQRTRTSACSPAAARAACCSATMAWAADSRTTARARPAKPRSRTSACD